MKIFCVGRNYGEHAAELKNPIPKEPVIFMKPGSAIANNSQPLRIPGFTNDLQHEIEVVLKVSKRGKNIPAEEAKDYFLEWTVGIDFTARDLQTKLKEKGLPWELAKSFDGAAVVGNFIPIGDKKLAVDFQLEKNGAMVQAGNTKDMLFSFDVLVSFLSTYFMLEAGDLIFTGTPAGVAKVNPGDRLSGFLDGMQLFDVSMAKVNND